MTTLNLMGTRIRQRRTELKMTQSALAEALGLSQNSRTTILKWEKGTAYPDIGMIELLCKCLKCDAGYLFGEYDCKTRTAEDIHRETGLSEKAINTLREKNLSADERAELDAEFGASDYSSEESRFLSGLIEDNNGKTLDRIASGTREIVRLLHGNETLKEYLLNENSAKGEKLSITQDFLNFIDRCTNFTEPENLSGFRPAKMLSESNALAFIEGTAAPEVIR